MLTLTVALIVNVKSQCVAVKEPCKAPEEEIRGAFHIDHDGAANSCAPRTTLTGVANTLNRISHSARHMGKLITCVLVCYMCPYCSTHEASGPHLPPLRARRHLLQRHHGTNLSLCHGAVVPWCMCCAAASGTSETRQELLCRCLPTLFPLVSVLALLRG